MLASIHPLGERARNGRWWLTTAAHVAGAAAGGALIGTAAGLLGAGVAQVIDPSPASLAAAAGAVALAGAVADAIGALPPSLHRQVNEDWLTRYRGWVYGAGFGLQLGLGVATIITAAAVYVMLVLAALTASPAGGMAVGAAFGLTRGLTLLAVARVRRPEELRRAHRRMQALAPVARRAAVTAQAAVAAVALGALL